MYTQAGWLTPKPQNSLASPNNIRDDSDDESCVVKLADGNLNEHTIEFDGRLEISGIKTAKAAIASTSFTSVLGRSGGGGAAGRGGGSEKSNPIKIGNNSAFSSSRLSNIEESGDSGGNLGLPPGVGTFR